MEDMATSAKTAEGIITDARWVACGNPSFCSGLDAPSLELLSQIEIDRAVMNQDVFISDHRFLEGVVAGITGPPGFRVQVVEYPTQSVEFYEFHVIQPMPDSDNPTKIFDVARKGYSLGAVKRDRDVVLTEVCAVADALALHEVKEWVRHDGVRVRSPHDGIESILH